MERNVNTGKYLRSNNFSQLTLNEKVEIKAKGRHTPVLTILQKSTSRSKDYTRQFNTNIYQKCEWFCGCDEKMLCFASHAWCLAGIYHGRRMELCIKC